MAGRIALLSHASGFIAFLTAGCSTTAPVALLYSRFNRDSRAWRYRLPLPS